MSDHWSQRSDEARERNRRACQERRDQIVAAERERHALASGAVTALPPLGDWAKRAECARRGADPEMFWLPAERQVPPPPAQLLDEQRQMARLCGVCPVRTECGEEADRNRFTGVWGGVLRFDRTRHDLVAVHEHAVQRQHIRVGAGRRQTTDLTERKAA